MSVYKKCSADANYKTSIMVSVTLAHFLVGIAPLESRGVALKSDAIMVVFPARRQHQVTREVRGLGGVKVPKKV